MDRRSFLLAAAAAAAGLAGLEGCTRQAPRRAESLGDRGPGPAPGSSGAGPRREYALTAGPVELDLGDGRRFRAYGYNGSAPGPELRVKEGDTLVVRLRNELPEGTTIHWHGVPVPNRMDGVPGLTQEAVGKGEHFDYEFAAWPSGTYLYHTHQGYQLDQGLSGPLIIEPKDEPGHDREFVVLLDDWAEMDGAGPAAARAGRVTSRGLMMGGGGMMRGEGEGMMGRGPGGRRDSARPEAGAPLLEPRYDAYTVNGRLARALTPMKVRRGDKVRLRVMNASATTTYYLRLTGHTMTITHADGRPVKPAPVEVFRIGAGERYDAEFVADNPGRWELIGRPDLADLRPYRMHTLLYQGHEGKSYSGDEGAQGRLLTYDSLQAQPEEGLPSVEGPVDRTFRLVLSGGLMSPYWTINGRAYPDSDDVTLRPGERVRLEYSNHSMVTHPMHLHGHFFELDLPGRPRKDTVLVEAHMGAMAVEFVADNPGDWLHHCHNLYHLMAGMAHLVRNHKLV